MQQGIAVHDLSKTYQEWILTLLVPIAFAELSRRFWLFGIKFYSGASA